MSPDAAPVPRATHEATLDVGGLKLTVYVLEDGRRVITEESMKKALVWLGLDAEAVAALIGGSA